MRQRQYPADTAAPTDQRRHTGFRSPFDFDASARRLIAVALVTFVAISLAIPSKTASRAVPTYRVTSLGPVAFDLSGHISRYICINNHGEVAANWMPDGNHMHGYVWKDGHRTDIGVLPGFRNSRILAINDRGDVVGYCAGRSTPGPDQSAFIWSNGKMRLISLPKHADAGAVAINDKDQILVRTGNDAFLWDNGKVTHLGVEGATYVNVKGEVIGTGRYHPGASVGYAYILQAKKPFDLGTLPGGWRSTVQGINDRGDVVGYCGVNHRSRAFLWQSGRLLDLGTVAHSDDSVATWINNREQIVGYSGGPGVYGVYSRAYLWQNGAAYDLNNFIPGNSGWLLISADCINERGEIVGFGHDNGQDCAFVLTPNP